MGWMSCGSRERDTRPVKIEHRSPCYIQGQTNIAAYVQMSNFGQTIATSLQFHSRTHLLVLIPVYDSASSLMSRCPPPHECYSILSPAAGPS